MFSFVVQVLLYQIEKSAVPIGIAPFDMSFPYLLLSLTGRGRGEGLFTSACTSFHS